MKKVIFVSLCLFLLSSSAYAREEAVTPREIGDMCLKIRLVELCQGNYLTREQKEGVNIWVDSAKKSIGLTPDASFSGEFSTACKDGFSLAEKRAAYISKEDCKKEGLGLGFLINEESIMQNLGSK